jgi:hypothetical protein
LRFFRKRQDKAVDTAVGEHFHVDDFFVE